MRNDFDNQPFGMSAAPQEATGSKTLAMITVALAGSNLVLLVTAFLIASQIQHRRMPPVSPPSSLLLLLYAIGIFCLLTAMLRPRFRTLGRSLLPHKEFSPQIFTSIALTNVCQYLGMIWLYLGGAFLPAVPFFAAPFLAVLLFILPVVLRRAAMLKR